MFALWWREHAGEGRGQVIDLAIYEPLFWILGPQALVYDQLGIVQERTGNAAPFTAPRNAYQAKDGRWLGLSASAQSIAERVMKIVGREDLVEEPWFAITPAGSSTRTSSTRSSRSGSGATRPRRCWRRSPSTRPRSRPSTRSPTSSPTRSTRRARHDHDVDHPKLGPVKMQNVIPTLSETPGRIDHSGPELGEHNHEVYVDELGLTEEELARLQEEGVI